MKLKKFILILLLILSCNFSYANPIIVFLINEFQIDSTNWKLELNNLHFWTSNLDSFYLTSITDTAFFKPGISTTDSFFVITQDSMQSILNINNTDDQISIFDNFGMKLDAIAYGSYYIYCKIAAPLNHQSINLREYDDGDGQAYYLYLDNTPTFGNANDAINAKGYVAGIISDSIGNPIPDVEVVYDYFYSLGTRYDIWVSTDSSGYFILNDFARSNTLLFRKQNYQTEDTTLQIWPEDTVTINVTLDYIIDVINNNPANSLTDFKLSQNYPNPFNNSTSFTYTLPKTDFVEIAVYDLTGKLVEKLFAGEQNRGEYKVHWNAESVASGIYVYQIKTNEFINHKKCLLIK